MAALHGDQHGADRQHGGVGEPGQIAEFACAERKAWILGVAAGHPIGARGHHQGRDVGGHVHAVGDQGHGIEDQAAADLAGQGQHADRRHQPGPSLVAGVVGAQIDAIAPKGVHLSLAFGGGGGHCGPYIDRRSGSVIAEVETGSAAITPQQVVSPFPPGEDVGAVLFDNTYIMVKRSKAAACSLRLDQ